MTRKLFPTIMKKRKDMIMSKFMEISQKLENIDRNKLQSSKEYIRETEKGKLEWCICQERWGKISLLRMGYDTRASAHEEARQLAKDIDGNASYSCVALPFYKTGQGRIFARTRIKSIKDTRGRSWRIPDSERVNEKNFEKMQIKAAYMRSVYAVVNTSFLSLARKFDKERECTKRLGLYQSLMGFFLGTTIGSFLVFYSFAVGWL